MGGVSATMPALVPAEGSSGVTPRMQLPPALQVPWQEKGLGTGHAVPLLALLPGAGVGVKRGCEAPCCTDLRGTPCAGRSRRRAGSGPQPSTAAHPPPPARSCWASSDLQAQRASTGRVRQCCTPQEKGAAPKCTW